MEFDQNTLKPSSNRELLYQQVEEQSDICDVTIEVGKWKKKFHWCVLVVSPFFECIWRSNFKEKQTGIVKLDVATPLTTETVILFLYGKKPELTDENVVKILELSEFLLIPNLKSTCVAYLKEMSITEENCMKMLEISSTYEFEFAQCDDYIRGHLHQVLQKDEALSLTKITVLSLLADPLLSYVSAEEKFKFAIRWTKVSQQNKDAFRDIFEVIDVGSMDKEFLETVVLQHPLVIQMNLNLSNMLSRNTLQDHQVLLFPLSNNKGRIACFDLEGERWCAIETGLPENSDLDYSIKNASIVGTCGSGEVYRVANEYNGSIICFQNLISKEYTIRIASKPFGTDPMIETSAYAINNNKETFVGVSNERQEIISRREAMPTSSPSGVMRLERQDDFTRRLLAKCIEENQKQSRYEPTATVYYGKLKTINTRIYPILTIRNTDVDLMCMNTNNIVGLFSKKNCTLHIYDLTHCELDTIQLDEHFGPYSWYGGIQLAAKENGVILYHKETVLDVSRLNGPDLKERYTVQKTVLEHNGIWDQNIYIYSNKMWFRILRKESDDVLEFSCFSHDALMNTNVGGVTWKKLQSPPTDTCVNGAKNAFMVELPKSMLRCHLNCPHCSQLKQEQKEQRRISKSRNEEAADYLYTDSDEESSEYSCFYDSSDAENYYCSSD